MYERTNSSSIRRFVLNSEEDQNLEMFRLKLYSRILPAELESIIRVQSIGCFWERLTAKLGTFIFELVGRKEISIVQVTYSF